jgi:hypothetical protein
MKRVDGISTWVGGVVALSHRSNRVTVAEVPIFKASNPTTGHGDN